MINEKRNARFINFCVPWPWSLTLEKTFDSLVMDSAIDKIIIYNDVLEPEGGSPFLWECD